MNNSVWTIRVAKTRGMEYSSDGGKYGNYHLEEANLSRSKLTVEQVFNKVGVNSKV